MKLKVAINWFLWYENNLQYFKCYMQNLISLFDFCVWSYIFIGRVALLEEPTDPGSPLLIGTLVSFQCRASSIPASGIAWYRYEQGQPISVINGSDPMVTISEGVGDGSVVSSISIVLGSNGFTQYYCVADNTRFFNRSRNATVIQGCK